MECERIRSAIYKMRNPEMVKRNDAKGWERKKQRAKTDPLFLEQERYYGKMKARRYRRNPEKVKRMRHATNESKKREYKRKINKDPAFTWKIAMRGMLKRCIERGYKKQDSLIEELGYTPKELKDHIESQFVDGMCWENKGEWQIDHIRPICTFPTDTPPNIVNALSNLRPLWRRDNLTRSRKWEE